ncbi:MAG: GxxExxY protein [Phycisphaerales bacterium]
MENRDDILKRADALSYDAIGAAIEVHRQLGPGLLESAYQACLAFELQSRNVPFEREVALPLTYRGNTLDCGYRMDFVVGGLLVLEIKAIEAVLPIHEAQLLTYLRLAKKPIGLILNFHCATLKDHIYRRIL